MKQINEKLKGLWESKRAMAVFSVFLAVVLWFIVVSLINPNTTDTIKYVTVDYSYNATAYTNYGLSIVEKDEESRNVRVSGDGSELAGLTSNDVIVYPDYSPVTGPGTYTLRLSAKRADTSLLGKNFEITGVSPNGYVTVTFDKVTSKKVAVTVNASDIQPAEGYYVDTPVAAPLEVTVRGPESEVARVDKVVANVSVTGERTESALTTADLEFVDKDGNVITGTYLTADAEQVEVTIPVLKVKEVPIVVKYTNVPSGYNVEEQLKPSLSQRTIRLAGPADVIDALESIETDYLDLSRMILGEPVTLKLMIPEGTGLRNLESLLAVDVRFQTTGFTTRTITVTNIDTINVPVGTTVTPSVSWVNNVVLVGTEEELNELAATTVIAQVDASPSNITVGTRGQQNMPVNIIIPNTSSVLATNPEGGGYTVLCDITTEG